MPSLPKSRIRHMKMKDEPMIHLTILRISLDYINVKTRINNVNVDQKIKIEPRISHDGYLHIYPITWIETENLHMPKFLHKYLGDIYKAVNGRLAPEQFVTVHVNKKRIPMEDEGPVSYNKR